MKHVATVLGLVLLYWAGSFTYRPWKVKEPDLAAAHLRLAGDDARRGRLDQAIAEGEAAIRANPRHAIAHYNLGCYLLDAGRLIEAEREFRTTLALEPGADLARIQLQRLGALRAPGS